MIGIIFVLHGRKNKLSVANFSGIEAATKHLTLPYEIGLLEGEHQTLEMAIQSCLLWEQRMQLRNSYCSK